MFLRTVYKPHSVHGAIAPLGDHLSGRHVAAPLGATYPGLAFSSHEKARKEDEQSPAIRRWLRPYLVLLPAGVTWPSTLLQMPVVFYTTFSPSPLSTLAGRGGCLFLWPSSGRLAPHGGFPAPGAIRRRALWSADFPRPRQRRIAIAQPT